VQTEELAGNQIFILPPENDYFQSHAYAHQRSKLFSPQNMKSIIENQLFWLELN